MDIELIRDMERRRQMFREAQECYDNREDGND